MASDENAQREIRRERQSRRLGTRTPQCTSCGETNRAALSHKAEKIICYECDLKASGRPTIEQHHFAGRRNDPLTVPIPGNDHRILSDCQRDWPTDTLRNSSASPLLTAAASIRGFLDTLRLIIERILGWVPDFLERLDSYLTSLNGEEWWTDL